MSIGKIGEFNIRTDNWSQYVERLEQYFIVNRINDDLKVPTLITVVGAQCYELLVDLCTPEKPASKSFEELSKVLERHLQPKPSILAERYKFRQRKQRDESLAEYMAVLKKISKTCEFGAWLEESLRDQFVCGIKSEVIRQRLFQEDNLEFGKAYRLAISMEAAEKNAAVVEDRLERSGSGAEAAVACQAVAVAAAAAARKPAAPGGASAGSHGRRTGRPALVPGAGYPERVRRSGAGTAAASEPAWRQQGAGETWCRACGGKHNAAQCRFARYVCSSCKRQGHLRRVCPMVMGHYNIDTVERAAESEAESEESDEVIVVEMNTLSLDQCKPFMLTLNVQNKLILMECDTGSAVSCISYECYKKYLCELNLERCRLVLKYYTGEMVHPVGVIKPLVRYKGRKKYLDLYVVRDAKTALLGRQWLLELNIGLESFKLDEMKLENFKIGIVNHVANSDFNFNDFSTKYCEVFAEGLGRFTGGAVSIHVRQGARPVFMRARPLAYALRAPVERALDQMVRDGILSPVERSDWATPIVPVMKKDGSVRICADYKLTLNKVIEIDRYPLPRTEDLLARLHGGQMFSKIDLSQAYAQFELDDSKKYTVINTHKGLFMFNRLVFGLASSPGIFQKHLEQLFADLPYVGVFLDDVIITGGNNQEHIRNLHSVFQRLKNNGLRVKRDKCEFFQESINYLGHVINKSGIHTCPEKVKAIVNTPEPTSVAELRSFIGMVMYYAKFIRNVSTILAPLYNLLRANVTFVWDRECKRAFNIIKGKLSSSEVLVHYSSELPLVLTADASSVGVGAVISHATPDGERPIAYASRSLTPAERAYSQIDREALGIIYGIRKFHQYLYGRRFTLRTDHKPLTYIFGDKAGIPVMAASRLQRWAVLLSGYSYTIEYVASHKNCADGLSRLPQAIVDDGKIKIENTYLNFVETFLPVTHDDVRIATSRDNVLSKLILYVQSGWPSTCPEGDQYKPYYNKRTEIYIERGCLMWGYRIIIPSTLRSVILKQLHASHMGIVKTKSLARSYVWWPNIDADVEAMCQQCDTCAAEAQAPPRAPPSPWAYDRLPWSRIHIDFLGPLWGKTYLVLIDSSTKWLEIFEMSRTNAASVIKTLRATFARFGLPTEVVSDRGPPFTSAEFREFLTKNGIRQSFSPAYHPASNGAAENAVKLCKRAIKKAVRESVDVDAALQTFLLSYRNSVHSSTGETPAMLLQRRALRSRLDLLRGGRAREDSVRRAQVRQAQHAGGVPRELRVGDEVRARNFGLGNDKWLDGRIVAREGSRRYVVDSGNGQQIHRHIDQIKRKSRYSTAVCPADDVGVDAPSEGREVIAVEEDRVDKEINEDEGASDRDIENDPEPESNSSTCSPQSPLNRPKRTRKPIVRFGIDE